MSDQARCGIGRAAVRRQLRLRIAFTDDHSYIEDGVSGIGPQAQNAVIGIEHDETIGAGRHLTSRGGTTEVGLHRYSAEENAALIDDPVAVEAGLRRVDLQGASALLDDAGGVGDLAGGKGCCTRCSGGGCTRECSTDGEGVVVEDVEFLRAAADDADFDTGDEADGTIGNQATALKADAINHCGGGVVGERERRVKAGCVSVQHDATVHTRCASNGRGGADKGSFSRNNDGGRGCSRNECAAAVSGEACVHEAIVGGVGEELGVRGIHDPWGDHAIGNTTESGQTIGTRAAEELDPLIATELATVGGTNLERGGITDDSETIVSLSLAGDVGSCATTDDEGRSAIEKVTLGDKLTELADSDIANGFLDFDVAVANEADGAVVEGDGGVVIPASLATVAFKLRGGKKTGGVVQTKFSGVTKRDIAGERRGACRIHEGAAEATCGDRAPSVDRSGSEATAEFEDAAAIHHGGAAVVVGGHQDHGTTTIASVDVVHIQAAVDHADDQVGFVSQAVGQDVAVRHIAGDIEDLTARTEAEGVVCTIAEGGGVVAAVLADGIVGGTEEGGAVTDLAEIESLIIDRVQGDDGTATIFAASIEASATCKIEP